MRTCAFMEEYANGGDDWNGRVENARNEHSRDEIGRANAPCPKVSMLVCSEFFRECHTTVDVDEYTSVDALRDPGEWGTQYSMLAAAGRCYGSHASSVHALPTSRDSSPRYKLAVVS